MQEPGDPELEPRRIIPALPMEDPLLGEIRWDRWERALRLTICLSSGGQADTDCETCGWPELRTTQGKTLHTPEPSYVRVARSTQTRDGRSKWAKTQHRTYWAYTHWAVFCPRCDEMFAWRRVSPQGEQDWAEIFHHPPTTERMLPPEEGTLF
ncbi:hypothetical protein [Streptomyces longwoodensis]|uniref:hypothetical protein n=1 Tax=Streptomyces longwoodensis TaxID=68231 RepID=UPI0036F75766